MERNEIIALMEKDVNGVIDDYMEENATADENTIAICYDNKSYIRAILAKSEYWQENLQAVVKKIEVAEESINHYKYCTQVDNLLWYAELQQIITSHIKTILYDLASKSSNDEGLFFGYKEMLHPATKDWCSIIDIAKEYAIFPEKIKVRKTANIKASKFLQQLFAAFNLNTLPLYDQMFAKISDAVTLKKISVYAVLSINPADYLTASNGNSWRSCHAYGGGYYAGNLSFAEDDTTICSFILPADIGIVNGNLWDIKKIGRRWLHYGIIEDQPVIVAARCYPSDRACTGLDEFIQEVFGIKNAGVDICVDEFCRYGNGYLGYEDLNFFDALVFCDNIKDNEVIVPNNFKRFELGGKHTYALDNADFELENENEVLSDNYVYCVECGRYIDLDNDIYLEYNGKYYCSDCFDECSHCGEWLPNNELREAYDSYGDNVNVCERCLDNSFMRCPCCGDYVEMP